MKTTVAAGWILGIVTASVMTATPAMAQAPAAYDPNPGAVTFSGAFDVPTIYYFRGIRQETDPSFTMWPYADLKIDLMSGEGAVKSTAVNFGVWNSLHTGTSGTGGASERLHYEEDFYAAFTLGFGKSVSWATQFTAYTSPNGGFNTVKEILFKVSQGSKFAPYGILAFEIGGAETGQADLGKKKGTYLELGVGPSWALGGKGLTVAVPVKIGMSLNDYYESPVTGKDNKFGYFDVGALFTVPFTSAPSKFGTWNFHAGIDVLALGKTLEEYNVDKDGKTSSGAVVGLFGIGVSY